MATLNVTITESITLNGKDQGGTYSGFSNSSITQVMKKQITCIADAELTLYQASDDVGDAGFIGTGAAWFDEDSIKYVRITNLAATTAHGFLRLQNSNGTPDEVSYKLYGKQSLLLYSHDTSLNAIDGAALTLGTGEGDIEKVSFKPISTNQDIELFIASAD
jgi:hypothetical protein